ncbi:hypothetical protein DFJ58DRAFT_849130, partial [Suillus subalutaceus]|uniref:uncharacterized protein n=1 Tax=Suillus subalutaceus TaxID=48586 RepID=UPI001B87D2FA
MSRVNAAEPTKGGKSRAGRVLLAHPITSFLIPTVNAECVIDKTAAGTTYRPPEKINLVDSKTKESVQTCRVPVMEGKHLIGYIPLPMRYQQVWLDLSYCIILYTQMWRMWAGEEPQNNEVAMLRRNCGAMVAQHTLARLLAVDEMREFAFSMSGKFAGTVIGSTPHTTKSSAQEPDGNAEGGWNMDKEGKTLLSPPDDLEEWFEGEIKGLDEVFERTLKRDALAAWRKPDCYFQTQYDDHARLPERWHEGHKPAPYFWSEKQWNWVAKGNSFWEMPMDLLFYVLRENPPYSHFWQFMQDLNSLLTIVAAVPIPERKQVWVLAKQLWMGEMTWREFSDHMMQIHLREVKDATAKTSEKKDPKNVFDTLEARMVLEGYVRRHKADKDQKPWDEKDDILWQALSRVAAKKYEAGWKWIVSQ